LGCALSSDKSAGLSRTTGVAQVEGALNRKGTAIPHIRRQSRTE
jgi:hypothetical protein